MFQNSLGIGGKKKNLNFDHFTHSTSNKARSRQKIRTNHSLSPWATQLTELCSSPPLQSCAMGNLCRLFPGLVSCNLMAHEPSAWSLQCPRSRSHSPITVSLWAVQPCPCWVSQEKITLCSCWFLHTRCWEHPFTQETSSSAAPAEAELRTRPVTPVHLFLRITKEQWLFLRSPVLKVFTTTHNFSSRGQGIYRLCDSPPQQYINNL